MCYFQISFKNCGLLLGAKCPLRPKITTANATVKQVSCFNYLVVPYNVSIKVKPLTYRPVRRGHINLYSVYDYVHNQKF